MTVAQAKAAIASSGIKGLGIGNTGPEGGSRTVIKLGQWPVVAVFNEQGRIGMLMGTDKATIDRLHGPGPMAPFEEK